MTIAGEKIKRSFGLTVRGYRMKLDISQEKLAELSGLHRTYISDIERGDRNVSLINISRIASALKIHPSKLLNDLPLS